MIQHAAGSAAYPKSEGPLSGVRMEIDRIREIGQGLLKMGVVLNERIQPILAPMPPETSAKEAIAKVPACDFEGELADLRRTLENALAAYSSLHERIRL